MNRAMIHLAYIDPGTGTLILQVIIAAVTGMMIFFRQTVGRFFGFFRGARNADDTKK